MLKPIFYSSTKNRWLSWPGHWLHTEILYLSTESTKQAQRRATLLTKINALPQRQTNNLIWDSILSIFEVFISPPKSDSFQSRLIFCWHFYVLSFPVARPPSSVSRSLRNFRGPFQKNFSGQKHAKFDLISDDFKLRRRIFPQWIKINQTRHDLLHSLLHSRKSPVNFGPLITEISMWPTEIDFFGRPYFGFYEVLNPPNFYMRQKMTKPFTSAPSTGDRCPPYNFFQRGPKLA